VNKFNRIFVKFRTIRRNCIWPPVDMAVTTLAGEFLTVVWGFAREFPLFPEIHGDAISYTQMDEKMPLFLPTD